MWLRALDISIPTKRSEDIIKVLEEFPVVKYHERISDRLWVTTLRYLAESQDTEEVMDTLDHKFWTYDEFRVIVLPVEATIPRISGNNENKTTEESSPEVESKKKGIHLRISREELYDKIQENIVLSKNYIILCILSAIVAAVGIIDDNVVLVIASMVIAPFFWPNAWLSLGTTLADDDLTKESLKTLLAWIWVVIVISVLRGLIDPDSSNLSKMAPLGFSSLIVAFASGMAWVLSVISGSSATLVWVMVAVALLPPLVTFGLALGNGMLLTSFAAFLLFAANVIALNLTGILTFLAAGIHPSKRREEIKAKKQTKKAILIWVVMLVILVSLIMTFQQYGIR